ncbi:DUF2860 domain-containing protein [Vibrio sp. T187]|uniref:DUF2860 family protein n=1 Tax=Vibrio TaxID=662 RepID=UPI0010CA0B5C|nr:MULTISPECIES: DUF2860 family protein [Vibrio]MBW3698316.1 DUF2860 domain-containing protein [Vibrio sp. T187]
MNNKLTFLTAAILTSSAAYAELGEAGFTGSVGLGTGIFSESSNLSTDGEKNITLGQSASSESELTFEPIAKLEYTFGSALNQQVYVGTHNEELINSDLAVELGYVYQLENGTNLDVSYIMSLMSEEVWQDPYAFNQDRDVTDVSESAFRFKADDIAGSQFSFDGLYSSKDVDKEASQYASMQRSGSGFSGTLSYTHYLDETSALVPSVTYAAFSAGGDAMSNSSYGVGLEYLKQMGQHAFSLSGEYSLTSYDATNEVFNKTQDDTAYGVSAMYQYESPMGMEDVTLLGLVSYEASSSNIDFYDSSEYQLMVGATYSF